MFWRKRTDKKDENKPAEIVETEPQSEDLLTSELFEGMRLDVTTQKGAYLLSGLIAKYGSDSLTLERPTGMQPFKTRIPGSIVNLNGYNKRTIPIYMSGIVDASSQISFKVKNVHINKHNEGRNAFRMPVNAPVSLYRQDDDNMQHPEKCTLIDLSAGGCCVQSDHIHTEDEVIRVQIHLEAHLPMDFQGKIIRCTKYTEDQYRYGILFDEMTEQETSNLTRTLFNLQKELSHW